MRSYLLETFNLAEGFKLIQNEFLLFLKTNKIETVDKLDFDRLIKKRSCQSQRLFNPTLGLKPTDSRFNLTLN